MGLYAISLYLGLWAWMIYTILVYVAVIKYLSVLKGTVARDFFFLLFYGSSLYGPKILRLKEFSFLFSFREAIQIF